VSRASVACVGIATLDLVYRIRAFPAQPVKVLAEHFDAHLGGMSAMAACTVARLGGSAEYWGPLGDDRFGDTIRAALHASGVRVVVQPVVGATSAQSAVIVDAAGERLLVNHRGTALSCAADVLPMDGLDAAAVLADVRWPAGAAAMLDHANARDIPTVLDAEVGEAEALTRLVPRARHVIFSEPGFAQWAGTACDSAVGAQRLLGLCAAGSVVAAVTRGAAGVLYAHAGALHSMSAFPVLAVDTVGAGDVFHGAYALALAERMAPEQALRFAAASAALKCTRTGGTAALPSRADVDALLA